MIDVDSMILDVDQVHKLSHEDICSALVDQTTMLSQGLNVLIPPQDLALWAWSGQLLLGTSPGVFEMHHRDIRRLLETAIRAALASSWSPPSDGTDPFKELDSVSTPDEAIEFCKRLGSRSSPEAAGLSHQSAQLLTKSHVILGYLSFPLLEGVLKRACSEFVDLDGTVVRDFSVPTPSGGVSKYKKGDRCSSLRNFLLLHREHVANAKLVGYLDQVSQHIASLHATKGAAELIGDWRNSSLHGAQSFQTTGGCLLSISLLILLSEVEEDFEALRTEAVNIVRNTRVSSTRPHWSFYPVVCGQDSDALPRP